MSESTKDSEAPEPKKLKLDESVVESEQSEDRLEFVRDKYENYVSPEELEKLKEFQVLDEVKSNDEESNDDDSYSSDAKSEELPEDEIDRMLDEDLPEGFKGAPKPKEKSYVTKQKIVLEEKGVNYFEVLPLDWMMVRHYSGMPVYVHRTSRVCTLSKPYFLGKGNTRRHDIPISAIPCLSYRRALEEEEKQKVIDKNIEDQIKNHVLTNTRPADIGESSKFPIASTSKQAREQKAANISVNAKCPFKFTSIVSDNTVQADKNNKTNTEPNVKKNIVSENMSDESTDVESEKLNDLDTKMAILMKSNALDDEPKDKADKTATSVMEADEIETKTKKNVADADMTVEETSEGSKNESVTNADKEVPRNRQPVVLPGGIVMPPPRVESVSTSWKTQHLTHEQVNEYCKRLFKFKTVNIMHFVRWADRRKYTKARKTLQYPTLPEGTKLITIPAPATGPDGANKSTKRDWVMNMNGRSYLSVFHEYVRRALQKQPIYEFVQLENAATPYQATVYIGGMQYGVGHGSSKRQAKAAAARASIHILIPEMRDELDAAAPADPDFSFFDYVGIEDPRITEFCAATCEPSPHAILRTCLLRNFGATDRHIQTEMKKLEFQKIELTMKVGKHSATVVCKNKKTAKQRASQAILQALHPHVRSWGSLLRLYGSRSVKSCKEKKLEEQQITLLQDKARHNEPNYAVLEKLRQEMRKLGERDTAVAPVGTLLLRDLRHALPTHSGANLNNVQL